MAAIAYSNAGGVIILIKYIIFICCSLFLCGCAAVVFVGTAGGMAVYDRRSVAMIERDARIFYLINSAISGERRLARSHIVIISFNQVVLLAGQVQSASLRDLAESIAQKTANVRRVYDEIAVASSPSIATIAKDTLISTKARQQMLAKKGLASGSIHIITENAVLYLMGSVSHEQADLAVGVARAINGVRQVVTLFQYI